MIASAEVLTVTLFFIAIFIAAVLFCVWVLSLVVRGMGFVLGRIWRLMFGPRHRAGRVVACRNVQCGAMNPEHARFCRRCGQPMSGVMRIVSSRAS